MYQNLGYNILVCVLETSLKVLLTSLWNNLAVFHPKIESCVQKYFIKRHKLQDLSALIDS